MHKKQNSGKKVWIKVFEIFRHLPYLKSGQLSYLPYLPKYSDKLVIILCSLKLESTLFAIQQAASVAQLDAPSNWRPGGRGLNPRRGRQHSFVEIDHEIFSTVILSLPLIQEGQLSVSGERMCTILVNRLED